jgi:uncharacterized protein GlcG (DUF336 family)
VADTVSDPTTAAKAKASEIGVPMCIAIADIGGNVGVSGGHYTPDEEIAEAGQALS